MPSSLHMSQHPQKNVCVCVFFWGGGGLGLQNRHCVSWVKHSKNHCIESLPVFYDQISYMFRSYLLIGYQSCTAILVAYKKWPFKAVSTVYQCSLLWQSEIVEF